MLHWIKISCRPQITFHIRSTLRRPPGTQLLFRQSGTLTPATLLSVFSYSFITLFKWSLTLISQGWLIWCPTQPSARSDSSHVVSSWQPQMIRTPPPQSLCCYLHLCYSTVKKIVFSSFVDFWDHMMHVMKQLFFYLMFLRSWVVWSVLIGSLLFFGLQVFACLDSLLCCKMKPLNICFNRCMWRTVVHSLLLMTWTFQLGKNVFLFIYMLISCIS